MTTTPQAVAQAARHAVTGAARQFMERLRPGSTEGRRSLPVRGAQEALRRLWQDDATRRAVLAGMPVSDATLEVGDDAGAWGTTVTVSLRLAQPVPGMAAQALAGKAVRRFKALAETGEAPTTERNPSARPDAGEPAV